MKDGVSFILVVLFVTRTCHCCGLASGITRVVGGSATFGFMYPWYSILQVIDTGANVCGGTLISSRFVLTAAHCYGEYLPSGTGQNLTEIYYVVLGLANTCQSNQRTERKFGTSKVHVHESYTPDQNFYDIALLELDRDVGPYFTPICLPTEYDMPRIGQIIGYGYAQQGFKIEPCSMRTADVTLFTAEECTDSLNDPDFNGPGAFCAGSVEGGTDTCQGDSGGPLQFKRGNSFTILGIVSFGEGCGEILHPGIYTDVRKYLDWIDSAKSATNPTTTTTRKQRRKHRKSPPRRRQRRRRQRRRRLYK